MKELARIALALLLCVGVAVGARWGLASDTRSVLLDAIGARIGAPMGDGVLVVEITSKTLESSGAMACCRARGSGRCQTIIDLRACHGELFDRLAGQGAAAVAFDLDFSKPQPELDPIFAKRLAKALAAPKNRRAEVIFAAGWRLRSLSSSRDLPGIIGTCCRGADGQELCLVAPDALIRASAAPDDPSRFPRAGYSDMLPGRAGKQIAWSLVPRVGPCEEVGTRERSIVPEELALSVVAATAADADILEQLGGRESIPLLRSRWRATDALQPAAVSYETVMSGALPREAIEGRVVMVGARFPSGPDAFDGSRDGYGVYAQARAVATLLAGPGRWPRAAPAWREWALILLSAILLAGLLWSERARRPLPALAVGAALAALLLAALGAMAGGLELPVAEVILGLAAGSCAGGFP